MNPTSKKVAKTNLLDNKFVRQLMTQLDIEAMTYMDITHFIHQNPKSILFDLLDVGYIEKVDGDYYELTELGREALPTAYTKARAGSSVSDFSQTVTVNITYVDKLTDETLETDNYVDEMNQKYFMNFVKDYQSLPSSRFSDREDFTLGYDCLDVEVEYFWDKKINNVNSGGFSSFDTPFIEATIWVREDF